MFPSLEPSDGHKVDEEFDKLTNESRLDSLLTKDTSKLDELLEVDDSNSVPLIDKVSHLEIVPTARCEKFRIFLSLEFFVKSILETLKVLKQPFCIFRGSC